jgi:hypothetical protein
MQETVCILTKDFWRGRGRFISVPLDQGFSTSLWPRAMFPISYQLADHRVINEDSKFIETSWQFIKNSTNLQVHKT